MLADEPDLTRELDLAEEIVMGRADPRTVYLGHRVQVKLAEQVVQEGQLLGFGEGGDIQMLGDDGLVWHGWPALAITPACGHNPPEVPGADH